MRKNTVLAVTIALVMGLTQVGYARYVSGFKVVEVTETQVVIQKGNDEPIKVEIKDGKFKVGDQVKYDAENLKVKTVKPQKAIDGC